MPFGSQVADVNNIPGPNVYVPGVGFKMLQGGINFVDGSSNDSAPAAVAQVGGGKQTYGVAYIAAAFAFAGDWLVLGGSASKTVKLVSIIISAVATAAVDVDLSIEKRSTADTAGTKITANALVPYDSNNAAATGTVDAYSAVPTAGTLVGILAAQKLQAAAAGGQATPIVFDFRQGAMQLPTLRGTAQQLALKGSATLGTGGSANVYIIFTEE